MDDNNIILAYKSRLKSALPSIARYNYRLKELNDWWGKIALIGKINSYNIAKTILSDMLETREKFTLLQQSLIDNLIQEQVTKQTLDNSERAQVAVDLLIRNLFERTADVGFLATDSDIRDFLLSPNDNKKAKIKHHLNEYVKKYSVYDEIIILDTHGKVMSHLNDDNPIDHCQDKLIQHTIVANDEYLETFRYTDLRPNQADTLVYSCKITETSDPSSQVIGVLCLCFRFEDEVQGIFNRLLSNSSTSILMLIDSNQKVIASSNTKLVAIDRKQQTQNKNEIALIGGTEYLATIAKTNGYQGFYGLGWSSCMASPLASERIELKEKTLSKELDLDSTQSSLFSDELNSVRKQSLIVNEDLRLLVINGKITAARSEASEFIPVLEEIRKIGEQTATVFNESINELQQTVLSTRLNQAAFQASLAVDIMDRNLYERANDCRWWALTSAFRSILKKPIDDTARQQLIDILIYINELYTVYTNLYIYDADRTILAVSNPESSSMIGQKASDQSGASTALKINNSQAYWVSPFVASEYYNNKHTYIYNAAIFPSDEQKRALGGIGIVFDSAPEFEAMLKDTLPKDDKGLPFNQCFGLFTDRSGSVISATENEIDIKVGDQIELNEHQKNLNAGEQDARVTSFRGKQYIAGCAASEGYREYKTTNDYENDVLALIFIPI